LTGASAEAAGDLGDGYVRPIGLSPALIADSQGYFRTTRWPPADITPYGTTPPVTDITSFPDGAWDPALKAVVLLGEALADTNTWASTLSLPHWLTLSKPRVVQDEIDELVTLIDYRPAVLEEALTQRLDIVEYWSGLLMFGKSSHPNTYLLARLAIEAGSFFAMHFKAQQYKNPNSGAMEGPRPRPLQLCPWLMPPIPVPGHASYPSGHATQAALLSGLLGKVMKAQVTQQLPQTPSGTASLLDKLAERVARNREVLGLHYPSDSAAGKSLASQVLNQVLLKSGEINQVIAGAGAEWP
jgi:membrane-associated phospholipid phosphatase